MSENSSRAVSPPSNVDDDPDLALAIALSLQSGSAIASNFSDDSSTARAEPSLPPPKVGAGRAFGTLTLDRKQMEKERLARALKRSSEQAGLEDAAEKPKLSRLEAPNTWDASLGKLDCSEKSDHPNDPCLPFPNGIFKRTWALGYLRTGDDIKIEEVLQKDRLQLAVLSSFQWDEEWLLSKIDCSRTKTILVAYAADDAQAAGTICVQEKWWKSSTFPRELLRDCESAREGLLLHSKAIFVRGNCCGGGGSGPWAYVGSANLSESAW
ncbi:hypothetical protein CTRI78_v011646 [Colletotrichum trifolii]|uniref:PLD phosphodiesterase domain-containing protein n=1 Tax=Colletotrichum trifolii TaxID=5466 RepID=A0A4R8QB81_COLTR|nr:hypothetical protein CTRI78_v011646 [Colletotrichum trifolii]